MCDFLENGLRVYSRAFSFAHLHLLLRAQELAVVPVVAHLRLRGVEQLGGEGLLGLGLGLGLVHRDDERLEGLLDHGGLKRNQKGWQLSLGLSR